MVTQKPQESLIQEDSLLPSGLFHRPLQNGGEKDKTTKKCIHFQEAEANVRRKIGKEREFLQDGLAALRELKSNRKPEVQGYLQTLKASQLQDKDFQSTGWYHREEVHQYSEGKRHEEEPGTSPITETLSHAIGNVPVPLSNLGQSYWSFNSTLTAVAHSIARASPHKPDWKKGPFLEKCCVNLFSPFFNVQQGGDFLEPRRLTLEGLLVMEDMKAGLAIFCDQAPSGGTEIPTQPQNL